MIFEYTFDADERYEDWMCSSIFSHEDIPLNEFEEVVKKAINSIEKENKNIIDWNTVANEVVKMDDRFFYSTHKHCAIIKDDELKNVYGG